MQSRATLDCLLGVTSTSTAARMASANPLEECPGLPDGAEHRHSSRLPGRLDLEGIVAKRKSDPYTPETVWYKIRKVDG
jgi:ATP-dependent DNA ligase